MTMPVLSRRVFATSCALALLASGATAAVTARIRGTIEASSPNQLVVRSREGERIPVTLREPLTVSLRVPAGQDAIVPNAFLGVTSIPDGKGGLTAVEVFVFPENLRGTGEGHHPFDFAPGSTMTNATFAQALEVPDGKAMRLAYKGGEQTILLTPQTRVSTYAPGSAADLKEGAAVFMTIEQTPDGGAQASRITVERR